MASSRASSRLYRAAAQAAKIVTALAVILLAWILFLRVFNVSPFVGKTPKDVWDYLVTAGPDSLTGTAASHRSAIIGEAAATLRDAAIGLAAGLLAGVFVAIGFSLSRTLAQTLTPVALVLRSIPLVAMTPLIVVMFGRGLTTVAVIGALVSFFPTLVNVSLAFSRSSGASRNLCHVHGAGWWATMRMVRFPSAVPALFVSLRIAAPLAFVGALLAEYLATGKGLGATMITDAATSDYNGMWARVVVATMLSAVLYLIVTVLERSVVARYAPTQAFA